MGIFGDKRKDRLYMAFYRRIGSAQDGKFHIALLALPKKINMQINCGTRYHVRNRVARGSDGQGVQYWVYEAPEVLPRTQKVIALLYIGKITDRDNLGNIFEEVPVIQDDPGWRCKHWVFNAIRIAVAGGVVILDKAATGVAPEDMWQRGTEFAHAHIGDPEDYNLAICDAAGNAKKSRIGPIPQ